MLHRDARREALEVTLVTALLDNDAYPAAELSELYGRRWEVETNLRYLKRTLGMDILHTKTGDGIQKGLWPCSPSSTGSCGW
jgi:IS4 transposase